jgi:signal transduction histidine kinase/CheY-like chemotaxis protein
MSPMTCGDADPEFDAMKAADFRFLVERNADGIVVVDEEGVVLFANPAAEDAFGRPAAELVGTAIGVPIAAGETTEIAILRPGGGQVEVEMRVVHTRWQARSALLVSLRDISARKAIEERLRQSQKMESIGRLTAGIAHDFNNLLTVIMGNLATIQREVDPASAGPRYPRAAEHAAAGAERAAALVQRLLSFARRQPLEPKPIDVTKLVAGMSDLLHRTIGEAVEIETRLGDEPHFALADPNQLEAAILNLAVNARDAMPKGGRLMIEVARSDIFGSPPREFVAIAVRDSGVGMSKETLAQAFEPFFTTKDIGQGTGLGLSQVFGFAKQSGGDVDIESRPGDGTTVTIRLPRTAAAAPETSTPQESATLAEIATILVVDDEDDVRRYSVESLRELGYRVVHAPDAARALKLLNETPDIRLLFSDVGLPGGLNGRQLAEEARRSRPDLKVLLTTGYAGDALVRGGRLEPGLQLLAKPFTYGALAAKVQAILEDGGKPPRILIVEDDPLVRMTIVEALVDGGCQIEEAATASEAIGKFRALGGAIDAALIDIGLPDGRGDGLIATFRATRPDLAILLATGYDDSAMEDQFRSDAATVLLEKPFDSARLRSAFRNLGLRLAS